MGPLAILHIKVLFYFIFAKYPSVWLLTLFKVMHSVFVFLRLKACIKELDVNYSLKRY